MTYQEFQKRYTYNQTTDQLGEGGFGKVFKAYDNHLDRWVAIKVAEVKTGLEQIRLKKEVELINKLPTHPNIARYEECYTFEFPVGTYDYGVLMYYEQGNLNQLLERQPLSIRQKQSILRQILSGIDFLHTQGIIHRDIKPQNILIVNRNGEYIPKITDFGISKQLDINKSSVFNNSIAGAGTLSYASPEQLGDKTIRKNTDLWSFGVIAYWLLSGNLPFTTGGHPTTSEAGRAELFSQINSGSLPAGIQQIAEPWQTAIRQCLVNDPAQRVHKASEIESILAGSPGAETQIIPPAEKTKPVVNQAEPESTLKDPEPGSTERQAPPAATTTQKTPKWLVPAILIGVLFAVVLFVWQPWSTKQNERVTTEQVVENFEPETSEPAKQEPEIILPSLSTGSATNLSETSASISGNISNSGNGTISERGIVYSTGSNPTTSSNKLRSGSGTGSFTANLSSLQSNTKYYARAYAINEAGTAYGNEIFFTTKQKQVASKYGSFTDTRDGKTYKTVKIGTQVWMAENLNYNIGSGSWCYDDNSSNCNKYGRLYDWETAKKACPAGWHLPSKSEFETLLNNYGGEGSNAYNALIPSGSSGFSALFGGWRYYYGDFDGIGGRGYFWSSSPNDSIDAWGLGVSSDIKDAYVYIYSRSVGFSVRCLQD